jgi:hypothetical protein
MGGVSYVALYKMNAPHLGIIQYEVEPARVFLEVINPDLGPALAEVTDNPAPNAPIASRQQHTHDGALLD